MNVDMLHEDSSDIFGKPIGFYSEATEWITTNEFRAGRADKIKYAGEPFDMKDSGDFLGSIVVRVQGTTIFFDATDPKKDEVLSNLLSVDIFGVPDDRLQKLIDNKIAPHIEEFLISRLLDGI